MDLSNPTPKLLNKINFDEKEKSTDSDVTKATFTETVESDVTKASDSDVTSIITVAGQCEYTTSESDDDFYCSSDDEAFPLTTSSCRILPPEDAVTFLAASIADNFNSSSFQADEQEILQVLLEGQPPQSAVSPLPGLSPSCGSVGSHSPASEVREHFLQTVSSLIKHFDQSKEESFRRFKLRRVLDSSQIKESQTQTSSPDLTRDLVCDAISDNIIMDDAESPKDILQTHKSNGYFYDFQSNKNSVTSLSPSNVSDENDVTKEMAGDTGFESEDSVESSESNEADCEVDHEKSVVNEETIKNDLGTELKVAENNHKPPPKSEVSVPNKFDPDSLNEILTMDIQAMVESNMKRLQRNNGEMNEAAQLYHKSLQNIYRGGDSLKTKNMNQTENQESFSSSQISEVPSSTAEEGQTLDNIKTLQTKISKQVSTTGCKTRQDDVVITSRPRCSQKQEYGEFPGISQQRNAMMQLGDYPLYGSLPHRPLAPPGGQVMLPPRFGSPRGYMILPQRHMMLPRFPSFHPGGTFPQRYPMYPRYRPPEFPPRPPPRFHHMLNDAQLSCREMSIRDGGCYDDYDSTDDSYSSSDDYDDYSDESQDVESRDPRQRGYLLDKNFRNENAFQEQRKTFPSRHEQRHMDGSRCDDVYSSFHRGEPSFSVPSHEQSFSQEDFAQSYGNERRSRSASARNEIHQPTPSQQTSPQSYGRTPSQRSHQPAYGEAPSQQSHQPLYGQTRSQQSHQPLYGQAPSQQSHQPLYGQTPSQQSHQPFYGQAPSQKSHQPFYGQAPSQKSHQPTYGQFLVKFSRDLCQSQISHREHKFRCDVMRRLQQLMPIMHWSDLLQFYETATSKFDVILRSRNSATAKEIQSSRLLDMMVNSVLPPPEASPSLASSSTKMKCENDVAKIIYDCDVEFDYVTCDVLLCKTWNERGVCSLGSNCTYMHFCIKCAKSDERNARHPMLECPY